VIAEHLTQASYLAAAALFIFSLRWLSNPKTARRGVGAVAHLAFAAILALFALVFLIELADALRVLVWRAG